MAYIGNLYMTVIPFLQDFEKKCPRIVKLLLILPFFLKSTYWGMALFLNWRLLKYIFKVSEPAKWTSYCVFIIDDKNYNDYLSLIIIRLPCRQKKYIFIQHIIKNCRSRWWGIMIFLSMIIIKLCICIKKKLKCTVA